MLRYTKWFVLILGVLLLAFVAVGMFLPSDYAVERSILVHAPPEKIHRLVGDLEAWPLWSPWEAQDPTIRTTLGAKTTGVGASQTWTGKDGAGELTFTRCDSTGVGYDMVFDDRFHSAGALDYLSTSEGTRVVWSFEGTMDNLIGRYMGLMMDAMVGPSFESGLAKLKAAAEALPDAPPTESEETGRPEEAAG